MNDYLEHHGILGQKWGIRRYQNEDGSLTPAGRERYGKKLKSKTVGELSRYMVDGKEYVSALLNPHDFQWSELSKNGMNVATYISQKGEKEFYSDPSKNKFHSLGQIPSDEVKKCNPNYGHSGTVQNCAKCSATLELNLRGFESFIAGRQSNPSSDDAEEFWFKNAKPKVFGNMANAEKALNNYDIKTSGTLSFRFPNNGGGHSVHWTKDSNGKFEIQDGQSGDIFDSLNNMIEEYGGDKNNEYRIYRLDNCEPNWEALGSDSVVRENEGYVENRFTKKYAKEW